MPTPHPSHSGTSYIGPLLDRVEEELIVRRAELGTITGKSSLNMGIRMLWRI